MPVPEHVVPRPGITTSSAERDRVVLARRQLLGRYLDPWGPSEIIWCHSHTLLRGYKVILNLYDLLPPRLNGFLTTVGLGGAFHSGIEVAGTEYAFGGHPEADLGITELKQPLFVVRRTAEEAVRRGQDDDGSAAASLEWLPYLRSRTVLGWWMGPLTELDQVLWQLRREEDWAGPNYRLLSRNCNHFARAMCAALLSNPFFKAAPGCTDPERMVPPTVTRLSSCMLVLGACAPCLTKKLNAPMPLAPHTLNIFNGQSYRAASANAPPVACSWRQRLRSGSTGGGAGVTGSRSSMSFRSRLGGGGGGGGSGSRGPGAGGGGGGGGPSAAIAATASGRVRRYSSGSRRTMDNPVCGRFKAALAAGVGYSEPGEMGLSAREADVERAALDRPVRLTGVYHSIVIASGPSSPARPGAAPSPMAERCGPGPPSRRSVDAPGAGAFTDKSSGRSASIEIGTCGGTAPVSGVATGTHASPSPAAGVTAAAAAAAGVSPVSAPLVGPLPSNGIGRGRMAAGGPLVVTPAAATAAAAAAEAAAASPRTTDRTSSSFDTPRYATTTAHPAVSPSSFSIDGRTVSHAGPTPFQLTDGATAAGVAAAAATVPSATSPTSRSSATKLFAVNSRSGRRVFPDPRVAPPVLDACAAGVADAGAVMAALAPAAEAAETSTSASAASAVFSNGMGGMVLASTLAPGGHAGVQPGSAGSHNGGGGGGGGGGGAVPRCSTGGASGASGGHTSGNHLVLSGSLSGDRAAAGKQGSGTGRQQAPKLSLQPQPQQHQQHQHQPAPHRQRPVSPQHVLPKASSHPTQAQQLQPQDRQTKRSSHGGSSLDTPTRVVPGGPGGGGGGADAGSATRRQPSPSRMSPGGGNAAAGAGTRLPSTSSWTPGSLQRRETSASSVSTATTAASYTSRKLSQPSATAAVGPSPASALITPAGTSVAAAGAAGSLPRSRSGKRMTDVDASSPPASGTGGGSAAAVHAHPPRPWSVISNGFVNLLFHSGSGRDTPDSDTQPQYIIAPQSGPSGVSLAAAGDRASINSVSASVSAGAGVETSIAAPASLSEAASDVAGPVSGSRHAAVTVGSATAGGMGAAAAAAATALKARTAARRLSFDREGPAVAAAAAAAGRVAGPGVELRSVTSAVVSAVAPVDVNGVVPVTSKDVAGRAATQLSDKLDVLELAVRDAAAGGSGAKKKSAEDGAVRTGLQSHPALAAPLSSTPPLQSSPPPRSAGRQQPR